MRRLPRRAAAVIVGGGVIGLSVAWHLTRAGLTDVVVLEAGKIGAGSSAKPLGGVRATFSDPANVELASWSLRRYAEFESSVGTAIGLHRVGYLFVASTADDAAACEAAIPIQRAFGVSSEILTAERAYQVCPLLDPANVVAASWSPGDGFAQPSRVVEGYASAARAAGASIAENTAVTGIELTAGRVSGVAVGDLVIATDVVVCCAGAWSASVGSWVGVDLPVVPVKRQMALTPRGPNWPKVPFTLDLATTCYFHNASFGAQAAAPGDGMLVGLSDRTTPAGFDQTPSEEWLTPFNEIARTLAPRVADQPVELTWAGLYENTPDRNALIGSSSAVPGFCYATGFSGHGFVQAPGAGALITALVAGTAPLMDPAPFSAERFAGSADPAANRAREVHII